MNVLGRTFLNSRQDGKIYFFVRCRRTSMIKKQFRNINWEHPLNNLFYNSHQWWGVGSEWICPYCVKYSSDVIKKKK